MIISKSMIKKIVEIVMNIINLYYILLCVIGGTFNQEPQLRDCFLDSSKLV